MIARAEKPGIVPSLLHRLDLGGSGLGNTRLLSDILGSEWVGAVACLRNCSSGLGQGVVAGHWGAWSILVTLGGW